MLLLIGYWCWLLPLSFITSFVPLRWRLLKAFYSPESTEAIGCSGITLHDMFPFCTCLEPARKRLNQNLTLDDIGGIAPEYICNVTVPQWRQMESRCVCDREMSDVFARLT